jgi:long-chain fatty acid transport protein
MEVGDIGAEALGRGGAFVAKADNPTAINYNPAGFAKLRGHHIAISASAVRSLLSFTRFNQNQRDSAGSNTYPTMDSSNPWFAAPVHLMATTDLGLFDNITLAAGFYAPSATTGGFPAEIEDKNGKKVPAPQRYDKVSMGGLMLFPALAVAFRPVDWIDVGLSFQWVVSQVKTENYGMVGTACDTPEDPTCDIAMEIEASDMFAPTGSAGVLLRPMPSLELGALVRLPSKSELKGKASVTVGSALKQLEGYLKYPILDPVDPEVVIENRYPLMLRLGARYIFFSGDEEMADIEANFIFENWAAVSERMITISAKSLNKPMEPQSMDSKLKNTFGLRVGASYRTKLAANFELIFRAGAFGETESTEVSDTSLQVLGPRRLGLTGGVGVRWGRFAMDAAYAHLFIPSRVVNQSTITAMDFEGSGSGPVVGNGAYSASVDMLAAQLTVSFGLPEPPPPIREPTAPIKERPADDDGDVDVDPGDDGIDDIDDELQAVKTKGQPVRARPERPRDPNSLHFDPEVLTRKPEKSAARRRPLRAGRRGAAPPRAGAKRPKRLPSMDDALDDMLGKDGGDSDTDGAARDKNLSVDDELDEMMGERRRRAAQAQSRRVRRSDKLRRGKRRGKRVRKGRRYRRGKRARRWARYRALKKRRRARRLARRGRRCLRRDHTGLCVRYSRKRRR